MYVKNASKLWPHSLLSQSSHLPQTLFSGRRRRMIQELGLTSIPNIQSTPRPHPYSHISRGIIYSYSWKKLPNTVGKFCCQDLYPRLLAQLNQCKVTTLTDLTRRLFTTLSSTLLLQMTRLLDCDVEQHGAGQTSVLSE